MNDMFPSSWAEIDVDQLKESFDRIDIQTFPNYQFLQKLQTAGMLIILLENDPLKNERSHKMRLVNQTLKEIRRQASILIAEYQNRVESGAMLPNSQPLMFLAQFTKVKSNPKPVVIGMKSVELGASINR